jgi:hypothetical protein
MVEAAVARAAASFAIDVPSLRARVRIALFCPTLDIRHENVNLIVQEQAEALRKARDAVACHFISDIMTPGVNLLESKLVRLSSETGCFISSAVHYLQSARPQACHFGLQDTQSNRLMVYASVNTLDWDVLVDAMREIGGDNTEQLSLSRIYVSSMAPRNTISHMLAMLVREYSENGHKAMISTIVDPNLGFQGASYLASNWSKPFSVPHLGYLYIDGHFCTRRELIRIFGSDNPNDLANLLGPRLQMSGPLKSDTLVFATATNRNLRFALRKSKFRRIERQKLPE